MQQFHYTNPVIEKIAGFFVFAHRIIDISNFAINFIPRTKTLS